jgi:hypothetical protein
MNDDRPPVTTVGGTFAKEFNPDPTGRGRGIGSNDHSKHKEQPGDWRRSRLQQLIGESYTLHVHRDTVGKGIVPGL